MTAALVPMIPLSDFFRDMASTGRLRQQLQAARLDAEQARDACEVARGWFREEKAVRELAELARASLAVKLADAALENVRLRRDLQTAEAAARAAGDAVKRLQADLDEIREAYRRELESNGKLREQLGTERDAFMAGVTWARDRLRTATAGIAQGLGECYQLTDEAVREAVRNEREIPF